MGGGTSGVGALGGGRHERDWQQGDAQGFYNDKWAGAGGPLNSSGASLGTTQGGAGGPLNSSGASLGTTQMMNAGPVDAIMAGRQPQTPPQIPSLPSISQPAPGAKPRGQLNMSGNRQYQSMGLLNQGRKPWAF